MKPTTLSLLLLSLSMAVLSAVGAEHEPQTFYEKSFDQSNGLCENTVSYIIQDRLGYIWMSTWDGLTRYDGDGFTTFKSRPTDRVFALPTNRIGGIVENSAGDIWCLADGKAYLFRRSTLQFEEACPGLRLRPITLICPEKGHRSLLIATDGTAYEVADGDPSRLLRTTRADLNSEQYAPHKACTRDFAFYADTHGNLYFRNLYTNARGQAVKAPGVSMIYGLRPYGEGSVLLSTNHGVYVYESPVKFSPLPGWDHQFIRGICVDRQGNIWMANYPGVTVLSPVKKLAGPQKTDARLREEFVRALHHDRKGRTWIADKNGCVRVVSGSLTRWLSPLGRLSASKVSFGSDVYCVLDDSKGSVWLGTKKDGLFRLTPSGEGFSVAHYGADATGGALNCRAVYALAEDERGGLWVGTYGGGLNKLVSGSSGEAEFLNREHGLAAYPQEGSKVRCLLALKDGVMLVGTTNGLISFSTREAQPRFFVNSQKAQPYSIVGADVMQMVRSRTGDIYIVTFGGGLNLITSHQLLSSELHFQQIATPEGLTSEACLTAAFDHRDNLWVVSEMAIARYRKHQPIVNFSARDFGGGFIFSEVQPVGMGGQMLVGTTQGLLTFAPDRLRKSSFAPRVVINRVVVEGEERLQDFNLRPRLELGSSERGVVVSFSTLDFNRSVPIASKYRVVGLDSVWKMCSGHALTLANLPPGRFRLEIASTNGDGMWCARACALDIVVKPKFGETILAKVLYSLLLIALGTLVFLIARYIRSLRAQIEEMQLAANEKLERVTRRIHELLGSKTTLEDLHTEVAEEIVDRQREFTERLMAFMNDNIGRAELQVGDIAQHMGMSKTLLYTKTKEALSCTPLALINDLRTKRAMKLLQSGLNVSAVAYSCGYSDPHYFSKCFKKSTGCSPTEYAAKQKLNPENEGENGD